MSRRCSWVRLVPALGGLLAVAPLGIAQPQPAPAPAAPDRAQVRAADMLANALARLTILDLRAIEAPGENDYRITATLLGLACEQRPGDADLVRRRIEAAYNAGDHALVMELTRALLALDPADTVAQLRLITESIAANNQNADDRLAAYDKFLGPEGQGFDKAIRSRLALDAALLQRERGDIQGFVDHLKLAMQLDASHKEAAAIAAAFFSEQKPDDRPGRIMLLQNLLMADPVDPQVHLAIARELASAGAFISALRFYKTATAIYRASGGEPDDAVALQAAILAWHIDGPAALARQIRQQLIQQRADAAQNLRRADGAGQPAGRMPKPEDIRLPLNLGVLAVVAADASGDREAARSAYQELADTIGALLTQIQDPEKFKELDKEGRTRAAANVALQAHLVRVWADIDADKVPKDIEASPALKQMAPEQVESILGWARLRAGDLAGAAQTLEPLAPKDMFSALGLALCHEKAGRMEAALAGYSALAKEAPLSVVGAWARTRLLALGGKDDRAGAAEMERAAARIPAWIDAMVFDPRGFLELTVTPALLNPESIDAVPVRVSIQNLTSVPLGLGPDRTLNSRILLSPQVDVREAGRSPWIQPEIVDIDTRLRLMPRERLEVMVNPDLGQTGWLMEAASNRTMRVRWRATQGFVPEQGGGFRPGVMCVNAESAPILRRPLPETRLDIRELGKQVVNAAPDELPRLAAAVRGLVMQPLVMPGEAELAIAADPQAFARVNEQVAAIAKPIAEAFAERYPRIPPVERALLVALLPHAGISAGMEPFDAVCRGEGHPLPLAIVLCTRVSKADDPLLAQAGGSPDAMIRELAFMLAERLGGEDGVYSRLTPTAMVNAVRQAQAGAAGAKR